MIANRRHTDLYEWGQRSRPSSLSAEIQQRLLPGPRTCEAGAFTLAAWLEPAADIAGDTFDYSLARDVLYLSMTDAMGHGVGAALTATLCVGGLRGARRQGASLLEQAAATNAALAEHSAENGLDDFVTGLIGRLDLRNGALELVNAGHVAPYLMRAGQVSALALPCDIPFGLFADAEYHTTVVALEPGDRVVLVTDGMLERNAAAIDLISAIGETGDLHPREAVRRLADSVLRATGHALQDDATVMLLNWHGGHERQRNTDGGRRPRPRERSPRLTIAPGHGDVLRGRRVGAGRFADTSGMGAKDWFVCYTDTDVASVLAAGPPLDPAATEDLVRRLFPEHDAAAIGHGSLGGDGSPADEDVYAAVWPGATIVCTTQVALDRPSRLPPRFQVEGTGRTVHVHAMHSVVDWFVLRHLGP